MPSYRLHRPTTVRSIHHSSDCCNRRRLDPAHCASRWEDERRQQERQRQRQQWQVRRARRVWKVIRIRVCCLRGRCCWVCLLLYCDSSVMAVPPFVAPRRRMRRPFEEGEGEGGEGGRATNNRKPTQQKKKPNIHRERKGVQWYQASQRCARNEMDVVNSGLTPPTTRYTVCCVRQVGIGTTAVSALSHVFRPPCACASTIPFECVSCVVRE